MDPEVNSKKVFIFQEKIEDECYRYGYSSAIQSATQLYVDNLNLEEENMDLYYKWINIKNESDILKKIIDSEIKDVMNDLTDKIVSNERGESNQSSKYIVKIIKNKN